MAEEDKNDITALTVQLLSAYVSRNSVSSESLADLIDRPVKAVGLRSRRRLPSPIESDFRFPVQHRATR